MPHSSGGGSSGGGFHGGSSFSGSHSSSGGNRISRFPFEGSHCYIYYDRLYAPRVIYSNYAPNSMVKTTWISLIIVTLSLLVPLIFMITSGIRYPYKLNTNYDTSIKIEDNAEIFTLEEENNIKATFTTFKNKTGITPALWTVKGVHVSLESYAYNTYVTNFSDEKHWLIVYQGSNEDRGDWAFEGIQGNDTDPILYNKITLDFNKSLTNNLGNNTLKTSEAIIASFDELNKHVMDSTYYLENETIVVIAILSAILVLVTTFQIINIVKYRGISGAVQVDGELTLYKCSNCGNQYYGGSVNVCPKCGQKVEFPHTFHMPDVKKEDNE